MQKGPDLEQLTKMINPETADSAIAMDFLLATKNGVRNCAIAITETATPEARAVLRKQLDAGLMMHEAITHLMMSKGWLHPYNPPEQFKVDTISAAATLQVASMHLFPDNTSRLGMYADPPINS